LTAHGAITDRLNYCRDPDTPFDESTRELDIHMRIEDDLFLPGGVGGQ